MSKYVVDSITYGSMAGYAKSHTTTEVPSMYDVEQKADRSSLDAKISNVVDKIEAESENREKLEEAIREELDSLSNKLNKKVDKNLLETMKSEILSNDRLTKEQNTLQSLFQLQTDRIHKECAIEYDKIKKEVDAFKSIDLNKELQAKLTPLDQNLKNLIAKIEATFDALQKVAPLKDTLAANVELQNRLASAKTEINSLVNKYAEERKNIQTVYEENKTLKKDIANLRSYFESQIGNKVGYWFVILFTMITSAAIYIILNLFIK